MVLLFIGQGSQGGERCLFVADDLTLVTFKEALEASGIDWTAESSLSALLLWTRAEWRPAGEIVRDFEAELRCKDGSIRKVLMDSSALFRDDVYGTPAVSLAMSPTVKGCCARRCISAQRKRCASRWQ